MVLDPYKKEYSKFMEIKNIKIDPFPIISPKEVDYWADNKITLNKIKEMLIDSLLFSTSNLYVFYSKVGMGKTFAANFLCGERGRKLISENLPKKSTKELLIFRVRAEIPRKRGEQLRSIYIEIIENLFLAIIKDIILKQDLIKIYNTLPPNSIKRAFRDISHKLRATLDGKINFEDVEGYKFLIDEKNKIGKINDINDMTDIILILTSILLNKYEKISIIIDELENLEKVSSADRNLFSDFIKNTYEKVDIGLNVILIYTYESYSDVVTTLLPALRDRIKEKIEFKLIDREEDIIEYIIDCFKDGAKVDPIEIIDEEVINIYSKKLIHEYKQITFREINREIHKLLAKCIQIATEKKEYELKSFKIDKQLYKIFDSSL
jgi:hypothetical protein